jgi:hypothetical protein
MVSSLLSYITTLLVTVEYAIVLCEGCRHDNYLVKSWPTSQGVCNELDIQSTCTTHYICYLLINYGYMDVTGYFLQ